MTSEKQQYVPTGPWLPMLLLIFLIVSVFIINAATHTSQEVRSKAATPPSWSYDLLPPGLVDPFQPNTWTFSVETTNTNPSEWGGAQEDQVFFRRLEHTQPGKNWTLKIGKGGQIYSIKTPQTGEMIALQRTSSGQWVDEVFQHTLPMDPQKDLACMSSVVDGDIHQAGYYVKSDQNCNQQVIPQSVYSPRFNPVLTELIDLPQSISYITWPQHAHLPRTQTNNLLLIHETVRDMGNGVIEITAIFNNWGTQGITNIGLPWTAFRTTALPAQIISSPDGTYHQDNHVFGAGNDVEFLRNNTTGGWIAFTQENNPNSTGIGIVYGSYLSGLEGPTSFVRWGTYSDGTVASVKRNVSLQPGETAFARYYLVIGPLKDIQQYGNLLASKVQLGKITTQETRAQAIALCPDPVSKVRRGCLEGETPLLYTYRRFLPQAKPLFLLQNTATNQYLITADPYEISFDPTDGKTRYVNFLGWAIPKTAQNPSCYSYKDLAGGLRSTAITIGTSASNLYGRVSGGGACEGTTPSPTPATTPPLFSAADFNADGKINIVDFTLFMDYWSTQNVNKADFNKDGEMTVVDYVMFMDYWNNTYLK